MNKPQMTNDLTRTVHNLDRESSRLLRQVRSNQKMRFSAEEAVLDLRRQLISIAVALDVPCPDAQEKGK